MVESGQTRRTRISIVLPECPPGADKNEATALPRTGERDSE